jgi:hypothetical protein
MQLATVNRLAQRADEMQTAVARMQSNATKITKAMETGMQIGILDRVPDVEVLAERMHELAMDAKALGVPQEVIDKAWNGEVDYGFAEARA